jgi:hypothetical protein
MYSLINPKPFNLKLLNLPTTTGVQKFPPIYAMDGTTVVPYTREQTLCITATFNRQVNYYDTACNIYCTVLLELSQMGISNQTHYLKFPLNRVSRQARYAYLLTSDSQ